MAETGGPNRSAVAAIAVIAVVSLGAAIWTGDTEESPDRESSRPGTPGSNLTPREGDAASPHEMPKNSVMADDPVSVIQSRFAIQEHGRIKIDAQSLPQTGDVTVTLGMPDDVRGADPIDVQIVSVDGRKIEIEANPLPGLDGGLGLAIDVAWLTRGQYMVQVGTREKTPLALRRYVVEIE